MQQAPGRRARAGGARSARPRAPHAPRVETGRTCTTPARPGRWGLSSARRVAVFGSVERNTSLLAVLFHRMRECHRVRVPSIVLTAEQDQTTVAAGWSLSGFAPGHRRRAMLVRREGRELRAAERGRGLSQVRAHHHPRSTDGVPILAHELAPRAPNVRGRALLQPEAAASGRCGGPAGAAHPARGVAGDARIVAAPAHGARLRLRHAGTCLPT